MVSDTIFTSRLDPGEHQAPVGAAKPERVAQGGLDFHVACFARYIIEITLGVRVIKIDCRRRNLIDNGHDAENGLDGAGRTEQMSSGGFRRTDSNLFGM